LFALVSAKCFWSSLVFWTHCINSGASLGTSPRDISEMRCQLINSINQFIVIWQLEGYSQTKFNNKKTSFTLSAGEASGMICQSYFCRKAFLPSTDFWVAYRQRGPFLHMSHIAWSLCVCVLEAQVCHGRIEPVMYGEAKPLILGQGHGRPHIGANGVS